jgi:RNA polymerase sigma-70 factor (ECF subfamily)
MSSPAEVFESHRRHLFAVAYRMLGSVAEAEDMVQESYLRWQAADAAAVVAPRAFLTTVVTRLCLDQLKAARRTRETYVGPWLPEPLATQASGSDAETLSLAFLVLLESLSAAERAAYLLHEVFDYSHAEVAQILDKDEAACRQLCHRARSHLAARRPRYAASKDQHLRLLTGFMQAVTAGDLAGITCLLSADAATYSDGGGRVRAALNVVRGADSVARLLLGLQRRWPLPEKTQSEVRELNGWPALVLRLEGQVQLALGIETDGEQIHALHIVLNPDKLTRL